LSKLAAAAVPIARRATHQMQAVLEFMARRGHWLALPAGLAQAAAFAPASLAALGIAAPVVLFLLWQGVTPRAAAWRGFLFTGGTFLAGTYWLYHSIHLVGGAPLWIAAFLMLGLVAIMGGYSAALGYAVNRWGPATGPVRWLVLLPAGWVLVEWFRGWFLSGFPWLASGYSQLATALRGFAPLAGVYGVSLAAAVIAGAVVAVLVGRRPERLAAAATIVVIWFAGAALARVEWTVPRGTSVSVALVQGAVPQSMKWRDDQRERTMALYADLTAPHLGADIIVWPEAALPALERDIRGYLDSLHATAQSRGSDVIMGLLRREPQTDSYFNGMVAFAASEQWYYKRRLVPFGEFFPVPAVVRDWLRLMNLPYSDFEAGPQRQDPLEAGGEALAPTICYEDAYAAEQLSLARRSTLLVNVTNDAWFGDSTAPHQHLDISRMRSLETGRPMLRATNDGITALIGHDGAVLGRLPQFEPGVLTGMVEPRVGLTPFARAGNLPVLALLLLGICGGLYWPALHARRRTAV
jgi:apolipoprotein N-acyltransferase